MEPELLASVYAELDELLEHARADRLRPTAPDDDTDPLAESIDAQILAGLVSP